MWNDNETTTDYLGFSHIVDEMVAVLTTDELLPLTMGVYGDWGSGKSSVLAMAKLAVEEVPDCGVATVAFNPWQYESYTEIQTALIAAVLEELEQHLDDDDADTSGLRTRLWNFVQSMKSNPRTIGRYLAALGPAGVMLASGAIDPNLGFELGNVAENAALAAAAQAGKELSGDSDASAQDDPAPITSAAHFRAALNELIEASSASSVAVFIDDLDRCLPDTVVSTFEAIRVFLNAPRTAFVIAANQSVVESSVEQRYPGNGLLGSKIGAQYLEKMIQMSVSVPPLMALQAETYINLLLAERHLGPDDPRLQRILDRVLDRRSDNAVGLAFGYRHLDEDLDSVPEDLRSDLRWAEQLAPTVIAGLRSNPRQLKRFLNSISMRQRGAARRDTPLQPAIIAKLQVLEETAPTAAETLYGLIASSTGPVPELAAAERAAQDDAHDEDADEPAEEPQGSESFLAWTAQADVAAWLGTAPKIGDEDLRPYVSLGRVTASSRIAATQLAPEENRLLEALVVDVAATRRAGIDELLGLQPARVQTMIAALEEVARREPAKKALNTIVDIASRGGDHAAAAVSALERVPVDLVTPAVISSVVSTVPAGTASVDALVERWIQEVPRAARLVDGIRRRQERRR